jgi:hypothetical protein
MLSQVPGHFIGPPFARPGVPTMDDTAYEEGPLRDSPSPDGSDPGRRTVAGPPDGTVLDPLGATVASPSLDRSAPDAGPGDPGAAPASEPMFDPPPDPHAATGADDAPPGGTRPTTPAIPGYEVLGELGRGGMGVVYQARQARLNRPCALKMILAGAHATSEAAARFLAEAEAVARLQHPNIVQIFHIDEHAGFPPSPGSSTPTSSRSSTSMSTPASRISRWSSSAAAAWPTGSTAPRARPTRRRG